MNIDSIPRVAVVPLMEEEVGIVLGGGVGCGSEIYSEMHMSKIFSTRSNGTVMKIISALGFCCFILKIYIINIYHETYQRFSKYSKFTVQLHPVAVNKTQNISYPLYLTIGGVFTYLSTI